MNTHTLESLEDAVEYFLVDNETRQRHPRRHC